MKKYCLIIVIFLVSISLFAQDSDDSLHSKKKRELWIHLSGGITYINSMYPEHNINWHRESEIKHGFSVLSTFNIRQKNLTTSFKVGLERNFLEYNFSLDEYASNQFLYTRKDIYNYSLIALPILVEFGFEKKFCLNFNIGGEIAILQNHQYISYRPDRYNYQLFNPSSLLFFIREGLSFGYKVKQNTKFFIEVINRNAITPLKYSWNDPIGENVVDKYFLVYKQMQLGMHLKIK